MTKSKTTRKRLRINKAKERAKTLNYSESTRGDLGIEREIQNKKVAFRLEQINQAIETTKSEAKLKGQVPEVYIRRAFSKYDPMINDALVWDFYLKLPFSILKSGERAKKFKELIQDAFEKVFLT